MKELFVHGRTERENNIFSTILFRSSINDESLCNLKFWHVEREVICFTVLVLLDPVLFAACVSI